MGGMQQPSNPVVRHMKNMKNSLRLLLLALASVAGAACGEPTGGSMVEIAPRTTMDKSLVVELVRELEAEVNNGGFDQFFFNSGGDRTAETISALGTIGAHHTARILAKASAKFPGNGPPRNWAERQTVLLRISPDGEAFEEEDEAFLKYEDDLEKLIGAIESG